MKLRLIHSRLLQALADSASAALERIRTHQELESRVRQRTAQLEAVNAELEAFSYSVAHDLRGPVRAINGFSAILLQNPRLAAADESRFCLEQIQKAAEHMEVLISDLLDLAQVTRAPLERECVNLSDIVQEILQEFRNRTPMRAVHVVIADNVNAWCDRRLVRIVLDNLLSNAWKFTSRQPQAVIEFGANVGAESIYFIRDNGAGFDMSKAERLFAPFERLHTQSEFPGSGIGLSTVKRVIDRHAGNLWAKSQIGHGSAFSFTLSAAETGVGATFACVG